MFGFKDGKAFPTHRPLGKVRFVCMHKKEKKFARAVSLDRQEELGSSVQRETSSTAREGKAGLMGTVIGGGGWQW